MLLYSITGLLMLTFNDCQEIHLELQKHLLPCSKGMRSDIDIYTIIGTVGPRFLDFGFSGWKSSISFHLNTDAHPELDYICVINIGPIGQFCTTNSTDPCYCHHINTTTGYAHFVVKSVAKLNHSQGYVQGIWEHSNGTSIYSNNYITLPKVYDVTKAVLTLKINGLATVLVSGYCGEILISYETNTIKLCCSNVPSPCYPRISLQGNVVAENKSTCVSHKIHVENDSFTEILTMSYSVCSTHDYITKSSCILNAGMPDVTKLDMSILINCSIIVIVVLAVYIWVKITSNRMSFSDQDISTPSGNTSTPQEVNNLRVEWPADELGDELGNTRGTINPETPSGRESIL